MIIITDGDKVQWRGSWGRAETKETTINDIEQTKNEHEKDGTPVTSVRWINGEWEFPFICGLGNGHWAYSYQLRPMGV